MAKTRPSEDIRSLSEFRANVAGVVRQVQRRRRPVFLTQHGRGAAVLMDVDAYEELVEELELLRDVHQAEKELTAGKAVAHSKALEARLPGCAVESARRLVASGHSPRYRGRPIHRQRRSDRCCGVGARPLRLRTSTRTSQRWEESFPRSGARRFARSSSGTTASSIGPRRVSSKFYSSARQTEVLIPRGWSQEGAIGRQR